MYYFLCNWQEVCKLFIDHLRKSPTSPYRRVLSIFARNEYQKEAGNLSHIHLILQVDWKVMNQSEKEFVQDLIRASILDVVRPNEVQRFIDEGIFECVDDVKEVYNNAEKFLPHRCNPRCLCRVGPDKFKCRKVNNLTATEDNTNTHIQITAK